MAGEPSIEFTGYAGEIKDFQDSSILNVSVHPGYTDKNTNQWVDKEPQFYGVRPLSNQAKDALNQVRPVEVPAEHEREGSCERQLVQKSVGKGWETV